MNIEDSCTTLFEASSYASNISCSRSIPRLSLFSSAETSPRNPPQESPLMLPTSPQLHPEELFQLEMEVPKSAKKKWVKMDSFLTSVPSTPWSPVQKTEPLTPWSPVQKPASSLKQIMIHQKPPANLSPMVHATSLSCSPFTLDSPLMKRDDKKKSFQKGTASLSCSSFTLDAPSIKREDKSKKLSQKERKRSIQKHLAISVSPPQSTVPMAWKRNPVNTSLSKESPLKENSPVKISLLKVQQEELFQKTEMTTQPRTSLLTQTYLLIDIDGIHV